MKLHKENGFFFFILLKRVSDDKLFKIPGTNLKPSSCYKLHNFSPFTTNQTKHISGESRC